LLTYRKGEAARRRTKEERGRVAASESDWRASLVPAAAVIPAPEGSVVDAAVKRSAVGQGHCGESCGVKEQLGTGEEPRGAGRDSRILQREVKFKDLWRTGRGEGGSQGRVR
jgi:hypothetical protein